MSEIETWLDEIQKRCEAATPGPWELDHSHISAWAAAKKFGLVMMQVAG